MNRLFTIMALAVSILLSSCMKTTEDEYKAVRGGMEIYSSVIGTQTASMDPTNIAVRLNTLIYEAAHAEPVITDLDKVEVINPEKPTDKKVNISKALFGNASVKLTDSQTGTYTITYSQDPFSTQTDRVRHGIIIIATGNKSLYEDGSIWRLTPGIGPNDSAPFMELTGGYNPTKMYYSWDSYMITGTISGRIEVSTTFKGYTNENYKANWRATASIVLGLPEGYFGIKNASREISMTGNSNGNIMNNTSNFNYNILWIDPLIYKPSCNWAFIKSGTEMAEYPDGPLHNAAAYPAAATDITWIDSGTDCKTFIDITYNGVTKRL